MRVVINCSVILHIRNPARSPSISWWSSLSFTMGPSYIFPFVTPYAPCEFPLKFPVHIYTLGSPVFPVWCSVQLKLWTYCAVNLCSRPFRVRFLVFSVNASLPFPMISLMVPWEILQYPPYFPSFCDTRRFLYAASAFLCTVLYTEFLLYSKCFSFRFRFCFSWPSPVRPSIHNSRVLSWFPSWFPPTLRLHFDSCMHLIVRHRVIPTRHYLYYLR